MRSESRIPIVLNTIKEAWLLAPDLRFNQLISAINKGEDCFYLEDDSFIEKVEKWIEEKKEERFSKEKQAELLKQLKNKYKDIKFKIFQECGDIFILHNNMNDTEDDFAHDIVKLVKDFDSNLTKHLSVCMDVSGEL